VQESDSNIYVRAAGADERPAERQRRTRRVSLRSRAALSTSGHRGKVRSSRRRRLKRAFFWGSLVLLALTLAAVLANERIRGGRRQPVAPDRPAEPLIPD